MRFLADENIPGPVVAALRERGDDVFWVKESMPGASDPVVLNVAQRDSPLTPTSANSIRSESPPTSAPRTLSRRSTPYFGRRRNASCMALFPVASRLAL